MEVLGLKQLLERSANAILGGFGYEVRWKELPGTTIPSDPLEAHSPTEPLEAHFPSDPFDAQQQMLNELRQPRITIFDVGANHGQTAQVYRAKFLNADIYCFEPFPDSVAALQCTFSDDQRVHIIPKAVSQKTGRSTFYVNGYDATNSLLPRPSAGRRYYPRHAGPKETIEVEVITLDEFVAGTDVSAIDILKLDIQGGELMALRGAMRLLEAGNVSLIYTEVMFIPHYDGEPLFYEIWSFLEQFGYSLFDIYNSETATNGQLRFGDALFVNRVVRDKVIDGCSDEP
jgi:FkbM family methyltransferase